MGLASLDPPYTLPTFRNRNEVTVGGALPAVQDRQFRFEYLVFESQGGSGAGRDTIEPENPCDHSILRFAWLDRMGTRVARVPFGWEQGKLAGR